MVNSADFAKRLQMILDFYGLSATAFSDTIDFNRSTISHLLSGRNKPSLEFVLKVLQKFPEVELYWLLNGKGQFPSKAEIKESKEKSSATEKTHLLETAKIESSVKASLPIHAKDDQSIIDRIVIFFKDGSFKSYS